MNEAAYWIDHLHLLPHPEGGFFKESYRCPGLISQASLPENFKGDRNVSTAIYFLLRSEDRSAFHKILSDEVWHFYAGSSILIYTLDQRAGLKTHRLGLNLKKGDMPQVVIPANTWFGSLVEDQNSFGLAGCTVAPGFDFRDFQMAQRADLLADFPKFSEVIERLT